MPVIHINDALTGRRYMNYSEAYMNEFMNTNPVGHDHCFDFRMYLTRTLINKGFIQVNSDIINRLFKEPIEKLFTEEFRNIFLYNVDRKLKEKYSQISDFKEMSVIGTYDLLSCMVTPITAKFFPLIEPFSKTDEEIFSGIEIPVDEETDNTDIPTTDIIEGDEENDSIDENDDELDDSEMSDDVINDDETIDGDNTEIEPTEDQIKATKVKILETKLDELFISQINDVINSLKDMFNTYTLKEIVDSFGLKAERYNVRLVNDVYTKIFKVILTIMYRVSIDENICNHIDLDANFYLRNIMVKYKARLLEAEKVYDNIEIDNYFSKVVLYNLFKDDEEFLKLTHGHYEIVNPVVNNQNLVSMCPSKVDVVRDFTENLINLRHMIEISDDFTNFEKEERLTGYFFYITVMFIQTFFFNAYLLDSKQKLSSNIDTIIKIFEPKYKSVVPADELFKLVKIQ